jgi:hypothetical protein
MTFEKQPTLAILVDGGLLGRAVHYPQGWLFLSNVSAHKNGRVHRETAVDCIPRWAADQADEIIPFKEWRARRFTWEEGDVTITPG